MESRWSSDPVDVKAFMCWKLAFRSLSVRAEATIHSDCVAAACKYLLQA
jgi:hypothetical protein